MRNLAFWICENKDADQLHGVHAAADQCLCFHYIDSTIPLLPKSQISSLWPSTVTPQPSLCGTWLKTPKTGHDAAHIVFTFCLSWQGIRLS